MRLMTATVCLAVLRGCSCSPSNAPATSAAPAAESPRFHTTPDKWAKPRIFQSPFNEKWADRMKIDTVPAAGSQVEGEDDRVFSANKAYWYVLTTSDTMKPGPYNGTVYVYNERDYLIRIQTLDIKSGTLTAKWINEKLLYMRVWLGRVMGFELIFDVEGEEVIYREMTEYGLIPFQQWQQSKEMQQQ